MDEEMKGLEPISPEQAQAFFKGGMNFGNIAQPPADDANAKPPADDNKPADPPKPDGDGGQKPQDTLFDITAFNKQFLTDFKDEGSIKAVLGSSQRISELEQQIKEIDSLKEENLLLKENLDPMKYFASEDDFKIALFKRQFPDKDPAMAYQLFTTDTSKMSPEDLLVAKLRLDTPDLSYDEAKALVEDKYGVEAERDTVTKAKMKADLSSARREIDSLKAGIKLPEKVSADTLAKQQKDLRDANKAALKTQWSGVADAVKKTFPDIVIKDKDKDGNDVEVFKYSVGKDFPTDLMDNMVDYMVNAGIPLDDKAVQTLGEVTRKEFIARNLDAMIKAAIEDALAKAEEDRLNKQHNPGKPTPSKNPNQKTPESLSAAIEQGLNANSPGRPSWLQ